MLSELVRPKPDGHVVSWIEGRPEDNLYVSALTFGEIEKGIASLPSSPRRTELEAWVRKDLLLRFQDRVLPIDLDIAARWGAVSGASETRGEPLAVIDALLAATSLQHGLVVATRNTADFERCGAKCVNPWQAG